MMYGTIQEAENLMMDGETYGCVKSFVIRETLLTRVFPIFDIQSSTAGDEEGRVCVSCMRSSMIYGNETRTLLVDVDLKLERAKMQMIRWMSGISMTDRRTMEELRRVVGLGLLQLSL